ncbi:hypothetical protein TPA0907_34950 [Micromonospora humidisoli]|uniref:hypothetical protein n=1 Tax=Micromonospora sp. AKA109 TaxID=2733865 RepID=UPI0022CBF05C|nr:hypothetical protein [Micromonospora sp. AKA109]GHJ09128.1 hypothetical protein TPA0907_34950 [Micromonospora sp. AKA109]
MIGPRAAGEQLAVDCGSGSGVSGAVPVGPGRGGWSRQRELVGGLLRCVETLGLFLGRPDPQWRRGMRQATARYPRIYLVGAVR